MHTYLSHYISLLSVIVDLLPQINVPQNILTALICVVCIILVFIIGYNTQENVHRELISEKQTYWYLT